MLTSKERETLVQIVRKRERAAKSQAAERTATLLAEFELQMDRVYAFDENAVWEKAKKAAERQVAAAQKIVAAECDKLGIPKEFQPSLHFGWSGMGENGSKMRRDELRRIATRQLQAAEKAARAAIERASIQTQEDILMTALTGLAAKAFIEKMPTVDQLMPPLKFAEIESRMRQDAKGNTYLRQLIGMEDN